MRRAFWDPVGSREIDLNDLSKVDARISVNGNCEIRVTSEDVYVTMPGRKTFSLSNVLDRLEALETAYMEDRLGLTPGKIDE